MPFIRAVRPDLIVVQSGRRKFGSVYLPDATVLARYAAELPGVTLLQTDFLDEDEGRTAANDQDGDDVFLFTDGAVLRAYQARVQGDARQWVRVKVIE